MGKVNEPDLIVAGFHRLDKKLEVSHPPDIKWGTLFNDSSVEEQNRYLKKLASSMNHAAYLIQDERDKLGKLCEQKEKQINSLKVAIDQNNNMIQGEITKMNEMRQDYNSEIASLKKQVRELSK